MERSKKRDPTLDEGWSWMVLLGSFIIQLLTGMVYCVGIFNAIFLEVFEKDRQTTAWIGAAQSSVFWLCCPVAGFVNQKYGPRVTGIIGSVTGSAGFLLTYFCNGYVYLLVTFSILVGVGNAFTHIPAFVSIGFYFKRYRNLAFGISSSAVGVGTIVLTPVINYCNDYYGWRGCMLIMAGLYMHTFVACALVRPRDQFDLDEMNVKALPSSTSHTTSSHHFATASFLSVASIASRDHARMFLQCDLKQTNQVHQSLRELRPNDCIYRQVHQLHAHSAGDLSEDDQMVSLKKYIANNKTWLPNEPVEMHNNLVIHVPQTTTQNGIVDKQSQGNKACVQHNTPSSRIWTVISNKNFALLNCNLLFLNAAFGIVFIHFADFFYSKGMTTAELSILMTVIGCCSILCRVLSGALANNEQISVLLLYISGGGLTSIFIMLCPILAVSYTGRVVFALGIGFYGNMYSGLLAPLTLTLCPLEELSMAYGIELFICGTSGLFGPPFAGWLYDIYGSHTATFLVAGCMTIFGSILLMLIPILGHSIVGQNQHSIWQDHDTMNKNTNTLVT